MIRARFLEVVALAGVMALTGPLSATASECGSELWAGRLDAASLYDYKVEGPDAIGGLGDYALSNGHLCAVISDIPHDNELSPDGGILIDLAHCMDGNDQLMGYQELFNLAIDMGVSGRRIETRTEGSSASVVVHGGYPGLSVETTYQLSLLSPDRMRVTTKVTREGDGVPVFAFAGGMNNIESLTPFTLSFDPEGRSPGFLHRQFVGKGASEIGQAGVPADLVVAVGASGLGSEVSYGQQVVSAALIKANGKRRALPRFFFSDEMATTLTVFTRPFWFGRSNSLSWFELLQSQRMDLKEGESLLVEQDLWVGNRADVASVTNLIFATEPVLSGKLDNGNAVVHLDRANGEAFTQSKLDYLGRFAVHAPAGDYQLRIVAPGGLDQTRDVTMGPEGLDLGVLEVGGGTRVLLPVGQPMRLVFAGIEGTPDPDFSDDLLGFAVQDGEVRKGKPASRDVSLMGQISDPAFVTLAPGTYQVFATRGPEYTLSETTLHVAAAGEVRLEIAAPQRAVETPRWIAADLHVHASPSFDNSFPVDERVRSFVAQGGEVMVSTEHDFVYDYTDDIARLGAGDLMKTVTGVEITSEAVTQVAPYTIGHGNAFPTELKRDEFKNGAPVSEGRRWRDVIGELRSAEVDPVIQLNHGREDTPLKDGVDEVFNQAFFTHLGSAGVGLDPSRSLSEGTNALLIEKDPETGFRDIDFDAMELMNGPGMMRYGKLREDWFSLLKQGVLLTGTANSDSHVAAQVVATPRTMVNMSDDKLAEFDEPAFLAAVREGRVYGTTGPLIEVSLDDASIGGNFTGGEGLLRVEVLPSEWSAVTELRVFVNGVEATRQPMASGSTVEVPLTFARDSFVTIEVEGPASEAFTKVSPGFVPFAYSNPIYVDADGDGHWTAPGL